MSQAEPTAATTTVTRGSLLRFRVMAVITGAMLIIVFLGMLRYTPLVNVSDAVESVLGVIAQVHGIIYIIYVFTAVQLWSQARWGYVRLGVLFLGGIIPVLSFFLERRLTRELTGDTPA